MDVYAVPGIKSSGTSPNTCLSGAWCRAWPVQTLPWAVSRITLRFPSPNGYQSLLTTLFGFARCAHRKSRSRNRGDGRHGHTHCRALSSKSRTNRDQRPSRAGYRQWLKGVMELQTETAGIRWSFIENVKIDPVSRTKSTIFHAKKAASMSCPKGLHTVDFAYRCIPMWGNSLPRFARVNRRLAPLSEPLQGGPDRGGDYRTGRAA